MPGVRPTAYAHQPNAPHRKPTGRRWSTIKLVAVMWTCVLWLATGAAAERPRLAVVICVDQLPQEYLLRMEPGFADEGFFKMVAQRGANFSECHHAHAATLTGPGHSVVLTGALPHVNGIVANSWYSRKQKRNVYCVEDSEATLVGSEGALQGPGRSPRNLLTSTVGDMLKLSTNGEAKVLGLSFKDRAAILLAGHLADAAFWYHLGSGTWITSNHYAEKLPEYLRQFNNTKAASLYAGQIWTPLYPAEKYVDYRPDESEIERGFPHQLPDLASGLLFRALQSTPYPNEMTIATAELLITQEGLGQDDVPDLLALNLAANDYIGHAYGPYSREVQDITYRTDVQLAEFVRFLDEKVGAGQWVLALTADHGVAPMPAYAAAVGLPAVNNPLGSLRGFRTQVEDHLRQAFGSPEGDGRYVAALSSGVVHLNHDLPQLAGDRLPAARRVVAEFLMAQEHVAAAFTREDLLAGAAGTRLLKQFQLGYHPQRSGDVEFAFRPYALYSGRGATHGSPWTYDTHVPLLLLGAGIRPGHYTRRVSPAAIAPTIARLLGVENPPACEVDALHEALER